MLLLSCHCNVIFGLLIGNRYVLSEKYFTHSLWAVYSILTCKYVIISKAWELYSISTDFKIVLYALKYFLLTAYTQMVAEMLWRCYYGYSVYSTKMFTFQTFSMINESLDNNIKKSVIWSKRGVTMILLLKIYKAFMCVLMNALLYWHFIVAH